MKKIKMYEVENREISPKNINLKVNLWDLAWSYKYEHIQHEDYVWICGTGWDHIGRMWAWSRKQP